MEKTLIPEELHEFIADSLHELAWRNNYPLNEHVATWCFLQGLEKSGVRWLQNAGSFEFRVPFQHKRKKFVLPASLTREQIVAGWKNYPSSSPQALYDSISEVYTQAGRFATENLTRSMANEKRFEFENNVFTWRGDQSRTSRKNMEVYLLDYFCKYEEKLLVPLNGKPETLGKPALLDEIVRKELDLDEWKASSGNYFAMSLLAEMYEVKVEKNKDFWLRQRWRSEIIDELWGKYLLKLAHLKSYLLDVGKEALNDPKRLQEIMTDCGWNALKIAWPDKKQA